MYIVYTQFSSLWRDDGFAVAAGSTTAAFRGSSAMRRRMPPVKSADFGTEKRWNHLIDCFLLGKSTGSLHVDVKNWKNPWVFPRFSQQNQIHWQIFRKLRISWGSSHNWLPPGLYDSPGGFDLHPGHQRHGYWRFINFWSKFGHDVNVVKPMMNSIFGGLFVAPTQLLIWGMVFWTGLPHYNCYCLNLTININIQWAIQTIINNKPLQNCVILK